MSGFENSFRIKLANRYLNKFTNGSIFFSKKKKIKFVPKVFFSLSFFFFKKFKPSVDFIFSFYKKNKKGFFPLKKNKKPDEILLFLNNKSLNLNNFEIIQVFRRRFKIFLILPLLGFFKTIKVLNYFSFFKYDSDLFKIYTNPTISKERPVLSEYKNYSNIFKKNFIYSPGTLPSFPKLDITSSLESLLYLFSNPTFFKYFFFKKKKSLSSHKFVSYNMFNYFFYSKNFLSFNKTNLFPVNEYFNYKIKKFLIKTFDFKKFTANSMPYHYYTILKFLEKCSGNKIFFKLNPFLSNALDLEEKITCLLWSQKVKNFRKLLGPRLVLNESLQILYCCLKNKDVFILSD